MEIPGGWSEIKPATDEVQGICSVVRMKSNMQNISEAKTNRTYKEFNAVEYRSQVVAGLNYLIKVMKMDFIFSILFKSIQCEQMFNKDDSLSNCSAFQQ
uniref:Cystatin domain-containing protein n=1 Tax=Fundulus heteroclitus TaxID=8078 RepID=A0A3Q2PFB2_FUNHE